MLKSRFRKICIGIKIKKAPLFEASTLSLADISIRSSKPHQASCNNKLYQTDKEEN